MMKHLSKNKFIYLAIAVVLTVAIIASLLTYYFTVRGIEKGEIYVRNQQYSDLMKYFELEDVKKLIDQYYIRDVEQDELLYGTLSGMIDYLNDGFSAFYTQEDYQNFDEKSEGSFIGEGMMLKKDEATGYALVTRVFADTPAYDANIKVNDRIISVDTVSTVKLDIDSILGRIRGIDGTTAKLKILSEGKELEVELTRKSPEIQTVFTNMINAELGYINIAEFSGSSVSEFEDALKTMTEENAKGFVIDLRGTPGGNISQATQIADMLLDEGKICYTVGKTGDGTTWSSDEAVATELPIVVLVDSDTSGVAEVFTGALQDRGRAQVVGGETSGRAVVCSFYQIASTGSVVKLMTSEYYTPNGTKLNGQGITPDEIVDVATGEESSEEDDVALVRAAKVLNDMIS